MSKQTEEWIKQAEYDLDTAAYMHAGGRHFYAVFMAHLALEKALKGLYRQQLGEEPPRTHNLVYLLKQIKVEPPEAVGRFLVKLNTASVATRYPEELAEIQRNFTPPVTDALLNQAREALAWIKEQL